MASFGFRLGRGATRLAALGLTTLVLALLHLSLPEPSALLDFLLGLSLLVSGLVAAMLLFRGARWLVDQALWRVRHRMVAVFFFVGVLPLFLGAVLIVWAVALLFGPLTASIITSRYTAELTAIQSASRPILSHVSDIPTSEWPSLLAEYRSSLDTRFPGIQVAVGSGQNWISSPSEFFEGPVPSVLQDAAMTVARRRSNLFLMSVVEGASVHAVVGVPLTFALSRRIMGDLGYMDADQSASRVAIRPMARPSGGLLQRAGQLELPPPQHPLDWEIGWPLRTDVLNLEIGAIEPGAYLVRTRLSAVWDAIFANQHVGSLYLFLTIGAILSLALVVSILMSVVVATKLTRTMTGAVNDLYVGTTHVNKGNFDHQIPVRGNDQISELAHSFNAMTRSIRQSIEDSKRHQQIQAELEIAREVQARLFPTRPPEMNGLEVFGICRPALSVSGDFFDYVQLNEGLVAISLGDVAGKGISAALVMASLHSIVRSQLMLFGNDEPRAIEQAATTVAERANQQLYEATSPEKYSTLFFAAYDARSESLTYANAGHLPPLLVRNGSIQALEVCGMVVGAFPFAPYTAIRLGLQSGDLVVAFTDGVTEPENSERAEFGEERLREALLRLESKPSQELIESVMDEVVAWTGATELQDDMTMLVVRKT